MTSKELQQHLLEIGFHPQAVLVYLSVLKHVQCSANDIAKDTGLPRSTVYLQVDNLVRQGILINYQHNKTRYVTAAPVQTLVDIAQKKLTVTTSLIPSLKELSRDTAVGKPLTQLFIGKNAIRNALEDFLSYAQEYKSTIFSITDNRIITLFPRFFPIWIQKREDRKIMTQIIATEGSRSSTGFISTKYKEIRFLNKNFTYEGIVKIANDRILFISLESKSPHAILIESKTISSLCLAFFRFMWQSLETRH